MNKSHIITGIISFALTIYLSIFAFGLLANGLYIGEIILFGVILAFIYLFLFYPINFIIKNIEYIKNGDLSYRMMDYIEENQINTNERYHVDKGVGLRVFIYLYFIIILSIANLIIVLPIKGIVRLAKRK